MKDKLFAIQIINLGMLAPRSRKRTTPNQMIETKTVTLLGSNGASEGGGG